MLRHYKRPALLIEFDEGKPFALQVRSSYFPSHQMGVV